MRKASREGGAKRNAGLREGMETMGRVACCAEKRRPEAGGTKTRRYENSVVRRLGGTRSGLALGEWGGGDDGRTFFDRDDLIGWDIVGVIGLAAGPTDFDDVGFSVIAEAEGED